MNQTIQQLRARKSVRAYADRPIGPAERNAILEAALQAPTAGNMTLYTILEITDQAIKDALAESCDHQPFIARAPMVLIFCADYRRWMNVFEQYVDEIRRPAEGDFLLAHADTLIAAQNAVVAAESLGIGSCYIGDIIERFEYHRELLGLPSHVIPAAMLCLGYPTEQQRERQKPPRLKVEDIVYQNRYDTQKAGRMGEMLAERQSLSPEQFADWLRRFCARKWNCDFSVEMSRSAKESIRAWVAGEDAAAESGQH